MTARTPREAAEAFDHFASTQCPGSPLYQRLGSAVAADGDLLDIAVACPRGQPLPVLFLASVHDLLLADAAPEQPLRRFYPSLGGRFEPADDPVPAFREFCLAQAGPLAERLRSRRCQTNEVRRCAVWIPVFALAASWAGGAPVDLVEIGASGGFNLLWDRYGYGFGGRVIGDANSPLQLEIRLDGNRLPPLPAKLPAVGERVGVDLAPVDLAVPEQVRWLRAAIWPDQPERLARLDAAIALTRAARPTVLQGDALALLGGLAERGSGPLLVYHSYTLNQFRPADRERLDALLLEVSSRRLVLRASNEWFEGDQPRVELFRYQDGRQEGTYLGTCDPHGAWLRWEAGQL